MENGTNVEDCLQFVRDARAEGLTVPIVLMGYCNPFLNYGEERLVEDCSKAGISGFIVVDLPPDEAETFQKSCDEFGCSLIPLVAPTTTDARMAQIARDTSGSAKGYVYCVSVTGVTGARTDLPPDLVDFLDRVRKHFTVPLAVGFGLSTREHMKQVGAMAEGVVMGSAVIRAFGKGETTEEHVASISEFCNGVVND